MNKKLNTGLFILGATVFNLLMMLVLFIIPTFLLLVVFRDNISPGLAQGLLVVFFFGALVGSFFLYGFIMKKIQAKYNLDQYLHPIFKPRKK